MSGISTVAQQQQQKSQWRALALGFLAAGAGFATLRLSSLSGPSSPPLSAPGAEPNKSEPRTRATATVSSDPSSSSPSDSSYYGSPNNRNVARSAAAASSEKALLSSPPLSYGNLTCPLELNFGQHMGIPVDPLRAGAALEYSLESGAHDALLDAVRSGAFDGRRAVLVGDSLMRYQFVAMGCLAARASSALEGRGPPEALALHAPDRAFSRGRVRLPGGGEIFFHPFAGKLNEYEGWKGKQESAAPSSAQSWVEACRSGRPFLLEGIPDLGPRRGGWPSGPRLSPADILAELRNNHATPVEEYGETVALTSNDVVFVNAAHHAGSEDSNHESIDNLLRCMSHRRRTGGAHPDWPSVQYVYSSMYHPIERDSNGEQLRCGKEPELHPKVNFRGKDDRYWSELSRDWMEYRPGRGNNDMVARNLPPDLERRHDLKVGKLTELLRGKPLVDCIHWLFPGVPDLWAAEMAKRMRSTMPGGAEGANNEAAAPSVAM